MRTYKFLAKRNQHNDIARLLASRYSKPKLSIYHGDRGNGVMVELPIPNGASRRSIDRFLHDNGIPGAVSGRNKYRVIKDKNEGQYALFYNVQDKVGMRDKNRTNTFILVRDGKMIRGYMSYYVHCECCGPEIDFIRC